MKERGKAVEAYRGSNYTDYNYAASSDLPCKKHPSSSSVGICAYCLKDRLIKLVCSDCGEQRLSSCSCSEELSSHRNSSCTVELGSVGRISFLIENEKTDPQQHTHSKPKTGERTEQEVILLKRSSSSCVEAKRSNRFWNISRLFRKKKVKIGGGDSGGFDDKSDTWMSEYMGVSRSRSLCSFRGGGGGLNDLDEGSDFAFSSAKISDVTGSFVLESEKQCGVIDAKSRFNSVLDLDSATNIVVNRSVFPIKESDFNGMDESGFIDLKLDLSSESKTEFPDSKMSGVSDLGGCRGSLEDGLFSHGGSCRITVNDIGIKKGAKGQKVWKWIFRHQPNWKSGTKKDENQLFKP